MPSYRFLLISILIFLISVNIYAADKYRKFDRRMDMVDFLEISAGAKSTTYSVYGATGEAPLTFDDSKISRSGDKITINGEPFLDRDGFIILGSTYSPDLIDKTELSFDNKLTVIRFMRRSPESQPKFRSRKKNNIAIFDDINIAGSDFIRGSVVSFWSDIIIEGEVNEDVIAVHGNISIGKQAVVRGDVVAIDGKIDIAGEATIYGRIQSSGGKKHHRLDRWRRWHKKEKDFSPIIRFYYNRVDGVTRQLGVQFVDEDSLLPRVKIYSGYAFSSEQWRYHVGLEQSFLLERPITIGGSMYRKLATEDDWIMPENDNTIFALIATEDYRDYYQAEGGYIFARFTPYRFINFEMGVLLEEYNWLDAHTDLWSLFGGNKLFHENYYGVPYDKRLNEITALDGAEMASLNMKINIDNRDEEIPFGGSFWIGTAALEWLPDGWNDDFDFTRYFIRAARFQTLNEYSGMYFKLGYGGSNGDLPIHRRFFLGGLETLLGYRHKEYSGREFWFGNAEYRVSIPRTDDVEPLLAYNLGQIAEEPEKLGDAELKQSIGFGVIFEESLRIDLAKRLDRSDSSFEIHVRLGFNF